MAHDPHSLMAEIFHWAQKGYTYAEDSIKWFTPNLYHVQLLAPSATSKNTK
ncbi:conserved hypothetical protein [Cupriavidus taiwanensis]|nr:conserved hypothetical protein [Cupriavidus taiwanensis]SOZ22701.1 conserved hypothetical protein [Cupriavidus taiwanensis]SOZ42431.1 conserved hypothetical protein [Cupriavidus taiwanensis]